MSPNLITQTIDLKPLVLVIGKNDHLNFLLSNILQRNGLDTELVNDFTQVDRQKKWYKIVWIDDLISLSDLEVRKTVLFLKTLDRPLMLISFVFTAIEKGRATVFHRWVDHNNVVLSNLKTITDTIPNTNVILGKDVYSIQIQNPLINFEKEQIEIGRLVDPQINFYPQQIKEFIKLISLDLISPWSGEKRIYQGKPIFSKKIISQIKHLYGQLFQIDLPIEKVFINEIEQIEGFDLVKNDQNQDQDLLLSDFVKQIPKTNQASKHKEKHNFANSRIFPPQKQNYSLGENTQSKINKPRFINVPKISLNKKEDKTDKTLSLDEKMDPKIESRVEKIFSDKQVVHKVDRVEKIADQSTVFIKKSKRKRIAFLGGVFFTGFAVAILILSTIFFSSTFLFKKTFLTYLTRFNETFQQDLMQKNLSFFADLVTIQTKAYSSIFGQQFFDQDLILIDIYQKIMKAQESLVKTNSFVQMTILYLFGSESGDTFLAAQAAAKEAEIGYKNLSLVSANLEQLSQTNKFDQRSIDQLREKIDEKRKKLIVLQQIQPLLVTLLAEKSQRTYAILVQDNQELRATGGFIHAVILVKVENGLVIDSQVYSSYQIDNMLGGGIAAPEEINKYLGETNWYFRDSNWDPDFNATANQVSWFLKETMNESVDGVLAINLYVIKDLIKALGPIDIPEFNEVITDKNIYERAEFHSEVKLADNDTQQDYLSILSSKLLNQLLLVKKDNILNLLDVIINSLDQGQMLFSLVDNRENQSLSALGWTGEILSPSCPNELEAPCFVDSFLKVESNVGVNKANYSLHREISDNVILTKESAVHDVKIKISNTSKSQAWPQGNYKNYLRIYLPQNAQINQVLINDQAVDQTKISQKDENKKRVVGLYLEVPTSSSTNIVFQYQIPLIKNIKSYSFFYQKQSGIEQEPSTITIHHDPGLTPTLIAPRADVIGDSVKFYTDHLENYFLGISF